MHRLRAVRRRLPGPLHLRPGSRQPARVAGLAGRALRLRVRDQLPALHPLRSLRLRPARQRPSPSPSCSSFPSPTAPMPSTPKPSCSSTVTANPGHLPWEDWHEGDERNTSGWVRATSPSGNAAYEGRPLWSGELGHGVRPAQAGQSDPNAADVPADWDISLRETGAAHELKGVGVPRTARAESTRATAASPLLPIGGGDHDRWRPLMGLLLATATHYPDWVVFIVAAIAILVGAFGVVLSRNPVHSALSLVLTLTESDGRRVCQSAGRLPWPPYRSSSTPGPSSSCSCS